MLTENALFDDPSEGVVADRSYTVQFEDGTRARQDYLLTGNLRLFGIGIDEEISRQISDHYPLVVLMGPGDSASCP